MELTTCFKYQIDLFPFIFFSLFFAIIIIIILSSFYNYDIHYALVEHDTADINRKTAGD